MFAGYIHHCNTILQLIPALYSYSYMFLHLGVALYDRIMSQYRQLHWSFIIHICYCQQISQEDQNQQ